MSLDWQVINKAKAQLSKGRKESTFRNYGYSLNHLAEFCKVKGLRSWLDFDVKRAAAFVRWLQRKGGAPATVRGTASAVFRIMETVKQMSRSSISPSYRTPAAFIPTPRCERKHLLSEAQIELVIRACAKCLPLESDEPSALIAALVYLGIRTAINATSLYGLKRECLEPCSCNGGQYLVWDKPRAGGQLRQIHDREALGVIEVVRNLQRVTSGAGLFSTKGRLISNWAPYLREWQMQHNLPVFRIADLRPAAASLMYKLTNGDIHKVQSFLQHRKISTTLRYLDESVLAPLREDSVEAGLNAMFAKWGVKL